MSDLSEVRPVEPGYYGLDMSRLSWGEFQRMNNNRVVGLVLGLCRSLLTDFSPVSGIWLPSYWGSTFVAPEEISERGMEAVLPFIAMFEREHFHLISYNKLIQGIWPNLVESCGATLIHTSGEFLVTINYQDIQTVEPTVSKTIQFYCRSGRCIGVKDTKDYFDPINSSKIIAMPGASIDRLWQRIQQERMERVLQGESIVGYQTVDQWKVVLDEYQARVHHNWVNVRKIYRKLTEAEVEKLRQQVLKQQSEL
ncbi:MAG: hypothetical protein QM758_25795 [Armatimonas sp.]